MERSLLQEGTEDTDKILNGMVETKHPESGRERIVMAESLFDIIPAGVTLEEAGAERLDQV